MNRLIKQLKDSGFFHIFGSNTINQMINFAYGILIVRVISKEDYGIFGYASNIYTMLMLISGFGVVSATLQIASEQSGDRNRVINLLQYGYRFGAVFNTGISLLILLVAILIPLPISGSNAFLGMMFLLPVPMIIKDLQIVWLRATLQNKAYGVVNTVNALLVSLVTILGAWLLQIRGIIIGQYVAVAAMLVLLWLRYDVPKPTKGQALSVAERKDLFGIAGISALNNALSQLLALLGTFVLGLVVADANIVASYKVASTIPLALGFIPSSLMIYVYPYFAKNRTNKQWVASRYRMLVVNAGIANLLIALLGIALARYIVSVVFGTQYLDAVRPFRIMMVGYFVSATFAGIAGNLLVTQRKLKINFYKNIAVAALNLILNILLIPVLGSDGAAIAHLLSTVASGAISTVAFMVVIAKLPGEIR